MLSDEQDVKPKAEVLAVLRRSGVPEETVEALDAALDTTRDANLFLRYGITLDSLGGSP